MTRRIRIRKGLDIPIAGEPDQRIVPGNTVRRVALCGPDYTGLKPRLLVAEGDAVSLGQPLFEDKRDPAVRYASPGAGTVESINRGPRRVLTIYGTARSRTMRVLWLAEELGLDYTHVPLAHDDPALREDPFLHLNPASAIPTIDDDGFALAESLAENYYYYYYYSSWKQHHACGTPQTLTCDDSWTVAEPLLVL